MYVIGHVNHHWALLTQHNAQQRTFTTLLVSMSLTLLWFWVRLVVACPSSKLIL